VVHKIRERVRTKNAQKYPNGEFDSLHIRRGDFQYKNTRVDADVLYENSKLELEEGATVYIATDERDKAFFEPFRKHYDILFLDDFKDDIKDLNTNYYGMLDQLIASRSRVFFGTYFSTFTGYINRMRGYHAQKNKLEGYENGLIESYYFVPHPQKYVMKQYTPLYGGAFAREFATSWRDIDKGIAYEGGFTEQP
jgi:hypothetical protein